MSRWIWPVIEGNWDIVLRKSIWAVKNESWKRAIGMGDILAFYVKGTGYFQGVFQIDSEWFPTKEPTWVEEKRAGKILYPWQVNLKPILRGFARYAKESDLVNKLGFVRKKQSFQVYLQGSTGGGPGNYGQPISEDDYLLIFSKMRENPEIPIVLEETPAPRKELEVKKRIDEQDVLVPSLMRDLFAISQSQKPDALYPDRDVPFIFEDLVFYAFKILGFDDTVQLGYKKSGSAVPDGYLRSHNTDYVVLYDAKVRAEGYAMSEADFRALKAYVHNMRRRNIKKVYCLVVSSSFRDQPRHVNGAPLTYLPADMLTELVFLKIQNPDAVNSMSLEDVLNAAKIFDSEDLQIWSDSLELEMFNLRSIGR